MDTRKDIQWAFLYFIITILLGLSLRVSYIADVFFNIRHVTHSHSHIGLLGWIYTILSSLICQYFLRETDRKPYFILFLCTQFCILGMLFSFPFGGYFLYSIIFSSLFIICTYWFSIFFLKRSKKYNFIRFSISKSVDVENDKPLSLKFVHWGIYFLILSSIGIWLLPVAIVKAGKGSDWYNSALYFFLHFQYNGWFLAVLFGLLVGEIEHKSLLNSKRLKGALYNFVIGTIGSVTLSWVGFFNEPILYIIGNISGFLLLASIFELYRAYMQLEKPAFLMQMFLLLCMLKTIFMFLGSFPWIAEVVLPNREFVISYLHFTFLGVIGFGVLHFLEKNLHIHFPYWSLSLYTTAFVGSEILITYKGIAILCELFVPDNYYLLLVVFSSLFFIAVGYWCYIIFRKVRNKSIEKDN
ncbi:MAG: hypothetical protein D8H93_19380 [Capnocytophaga sp.]|uniref:Beta-carotene 15,15'-monooxygenase n=1 Tax=Capnocytophaga gingivalis TaxID=1017 RepID=A0ABU5Z4D6_9FLAO|nr:hypothetical protein [Capnocytophaga gingivalis]MEB3073816.1 hypothetical protein [Capnocytophaga gingivalis]RKW10594.1 MAG: hypothetical protein D8H93_19380 [Capnocytophaga sp.]